MSCSTRASRGWPSAASSPGCSDEAARPGDGIRGGHIDVGGVFTGQWAVVALGPHIAGAMLARAAPGSHSKFEFTVTHDRQRVTAAARCLLRWLGPTEGRSPTDITWDNQ